MNEVVCGDCLEVMGRIVSGTVDLVVTSPPYNMLGLPGGLRQRGVGLWRRGPLQEGYDGHDDRMDPAEYIEWQRACLGEMMRVLSDDGAVFYNHKWRIRDGLLDDRSAIVRGFPVRQVIVWHRGNGINFNPGYFLPTYEVVYLIAKPGFGWFRARAG